MSIWFLALGLGAATSVATAEDLSLDPRCLAPRDLSRGSASEIERFNKTCAVEQEVIRLTNVNRARHGLPALKTDKRMSYIARYQASLPYRVHAYFHEGFHARWYREWFPQAPAVASVGENAWPPAFQGESEIDIAFNLADSTAPASDGNPKGWNHHPGHAQNTLMNGATHIAVGVNLGEDGSVTAYTEFLRSDVP
jgi:uncharacterized protein YkwD